MRLGNEDVLFNISLVNKYNNRILKELKVICNDMSFLFCNKLKNHIFTSILAPLDSISHEVSAHLGILMMILLYNESEDMITAHYLHCIKLESLHETKKHDYMPIEKYLKISCEDRVKYHNEKIISAFIAPRKIAELKSDTAIHVLNFVYTEIELLYFLPYKIFFTDKTIQKMRDLSKKTAHKWDSFSNEAHVKWKEEIDKIKSINL